MHQCSLKHYLQQPGHGSKQNDKGTDKEDVIHVYNGISLSYKKELNNVIYSNVNGPRDCHTEWSQTERDKYHPPLIYGI